MRIGIAIDPGALLDQVPVEPVRQPFHLADEAHQLGRCAGDLIDSPVARLREQRHQLLEAIFRMSAA